MHARLEPICVLLSAAILALAPQPARADQPLTSLPYTPSLEPGFMDRSVDPCTDFYTYSCGGWQKQNPVPGDQSSWGVYGKLHNDNQRYLWGLLQESAKQDPGRTPAQQKIGDYFASCMDEGTIEKAGVGPLKPELAAITGMKSKKELGKLLGKLHLEASTSGLFFGFGSGQDAKDSTEMIAMAFAGGLGLPDRDYYFKEDPKSAETRQKYQEHVARMFTLLGDAPDKAAEEARTVMRLETALAKASLTVVEKRDPYKIYHRMPVAELQKLNPSINWKEYLTAIGSSKLASLNVTEPEFFKGLEALISAEKLVDLQTYLRWHLVNERAAYLSQPFLQASFDFYSGYLRGVKEMPPRWKKCVRLVDRDLGEALGEVFVSKAFGPDVKQATLDMVKEIQAVMAVRIKALPWMSEATKQQALEKLNLMRNKIGYPDKWRDYGKFQVKAGDFMGNVTRGLTFESHRQLDRIGKPVDRGEWSMTPPTVNAYYDPSMNDMNFPAGILLPPLFDLKMDAAPNYGDTGSTIGHELTHGFDDEGRQFDAHGNLRDWWTEQDAKEFEKRVSCVADQYAKYVVVDDIKINSRLTLGEDVADLGGTLLAYYAWKEVTKNQKLETKDNLTPDQRYFVGMAQWACSNQTVEDKRLKALTNPHSPEIYRVNGVVSNIPEFAAAFSCKAGQPMVSENVCKVW